MKNSVSAPSRRRNVRRPRFVLAACSLVFAALAGCATPGEMLGWAKDEPFVITPDQMAQYAVPKPVFAKKFERTSFDLVKVCLTCGDYSDTHTIGTDHQAMRLKRDFVNLVARTLESSGLFQPGDGAGFKVQATLLALEQASSVGYQVEHDHPMTSGAVLTTKITIRYDLIDAGQVLDSWTITTTATSNSVVASTRLTENIDGALKRNLRALLLSIVADHSPENGAQARQALASLQSEVDNKRIALGYVAYGVAKTVSSVTSAAGDVLSAVAENPGAVAAGMNNVATTMASVDRATASAYDQALQQRRYAGVAASDHSVSSTSSSSNSSSVSNSGSGGSAAAQGDHKERAKGSTGTGSGVNGTTSTTQSTSSSSRPAGGLSASGSTTTASAATNSSGSASRLARERDNDSSSSSSSRASTEPAPARKKKKTEWGPQQKEAIAVCRQGKSGGWACNGPLDNQIIFDEPTVESALKRQGCEGATRTAVPATVDGKPWDSYRCNHALGAGDWDVAKRYGLTMLQRTFMCEKDKPSDGRCESFYDGQDLRGDDAPR